ncbi:MAG TPA: twin-arginine translocation signal domain-containing protein, partial [Phycisphaerales bacterium]|nr:twin-arginine translocation signal domain-containing protein [Phycisphaerales bacterium]
MDDRIDRRRFLGASLAGAALGAAAGRPVLGLGYLVGDDKAKNVGLPLEKLIHAQSGMKIKTVESFTEDEPIPRVAFVRVTTEDGAEGWGQVAPFNADITVMVLHRDVAPLAIGKDPYDVGALSQ